MLIASFVRGKAGGHVGTVRRGVGGIFFNGLLVDATLGAAVDGVVAIPEGLVYDELVCVASFRFASSLLRILGLLREGFFSTGGYHGRLIGESVVCLVGGFVYFRVLCLFFYCGHVTRGSQFHSFGHTFVSAPLGRYVHYIFVPTSFSIWDVYGVFH